MNTPYFPCFRSRLAALGRRTARSVRQATLDQLQQQLRHVLPAPLLSATDEGPNSRERICSLRLTLECFLWQVLTHPRPPAARSCGTSKPSSACRAGGLLTRATRPTSRLASACRRSGWKSLRDLKTMLGMEQLRCKSPEMAQKELLAYLVAHNLIRCLIAEAVATYHVQLERVSFKGSVDALRQYSNAISRARNRQMRDQLWEDLLLNLARDLVPDRPHRLEPRALKRRPKNFGWLTKPRHKFRECLHRNRHWKSNPRNLRALN